MLKEGSPDEAGHKQSELEQAKRLFMALTEQLKTPLTQIARLSELAKINNYTRESLKEIESSSLAALSLIDSYMLNNRINLGQQIISFEPLSAPLILQEVAHELEPMASQYNCKLVIKNIGKSPPIMANSKALRVAMASLASVFIEASQNSSKKKRQVSLVTKKESEGVLTGVFTKNEVLNAKVLANAQKLYGQAKMPIPNLANTGAGIFIAESLIESLSAQLKFSRYLNQQAFVK